MLQKSLTIFIIIITLCIYLLFLMWKQTLADDFSSLYTGIQYALSGKNPYLLLVNSQIPKLTLAYNLNPPPSLWLFSFFINFSLSHAIIIYKLCWLLLGTIAAALTIKILYPTSSLKEWTFFLLLFFAFTGSIYNFLLNQMGYILFFFLIFGYYCYKNNNNLLAGISFGVICTIKLFPSLLLFFVLVDKRYKTLIAAVTTILFLNYVTWYNFGTQVYLDYLNAVLKTYWLADSWNGSLWGLLLRISIFNMSINKLIFLIITYLICFSLILIIYIFGLKKYVKTKVDLCFSLTLILMLILSPAGWVYYYPILFFSILLLLKYYGNTTNNQILFVLCFTFILINYPIFYIRAHQFADNMFILFTFCSTYFYGLVLLLSLNIKALEFHSVKNTIILPANIKILLMLGLALSLMILFNRNLSVYAINNVKSNLGNFSLNNT